MDQATLEWFKTFCLCVLLVVLCFAANSIANHFNSLLDALKDEIPTADSHLSAIQTSIQKVTANTSAMVKVAQQIEVQERAAFTNQQTSLTQISESTNKLLVSANDAVQKLLPVENDLDNVVKQFGTDSHATLGEGQEVLQSANQIFTDLDKPILALNTSVAELNVGINNLNETSNHLDHMSSDSDIYLHQWLFPSRPKKFFNFLENTVIIGAKFLVVK